MALSSATSEQCAVLTESRASKEENMLGGLRETATCNSNHICLVLLCDSQEVRLPAPEAGRSLQPCFVWNQG